MSVDVKKLRELAEAVIYGPMTSNVSKPNFKRFQEAADPEVVLALITELEAARKLSQYYAVHWDNCPKQKALDVKCTCGVEALLEKVTHE